MTAPKSAPKGAIKTMNSAEMRALVDQSMSEMDNMTHALVHAGENPVDAKLKVQQLYFKNLKMAGDPAAMMQKTMAEMSTRIELDRIINPDTEDLVSEKYKDLVELQMKAIKTLNSLAPSVTHNINIKDDNSMKFAKFIDVENMDE